MSLIDQVMTFGCRRGSVTDGATADAGLVEEVLLRLSPDPRVGGWSDGWVR